MPVFAPYRAIGYICDSTNFCVQRRGKETFVTTSVGKAWQIYNCAKLSLVFVGPMMDKRIRSLCSWRDFTFAAVGNTIVVFNRAKKVCTWESHKDKIVFLLTFGDHVVSIGLDRILAIWRANTPSTSEQPEGEIQLADDFTPTCIIHPETYLNKVLIGSEEGELQLWNINSKKLLHRFSGWKSPVRCLESSPALDTVAVGCADGKIHIHNIKFDETLMSFTHSTNEAVTALSFRSDGQPFLAAGGTSGVISVWDLEKRKLKTVIKDGHDGRVVSLHFLAREPILLSSGADNALKMWIFDTPDGEARLLRFRSGHSAPPSCISYYGNGKHILSAGQDRAFRLFSTIQDQQSRELSQGHTGRKAKKLKLKEEEVKLSRVVAFASSEIHERDWCNVVTCHEDDTSAYTWRLQNFVIGEHVLQLRGGKQSPITACAISACGNFAFLGSQAGRVERFNLQSGLHRGTFQMKREQYSPAHLGPVIGLDSDATNSKLFTAGHDGLVKAWNFKTAQLLTTVDAGSPLTKLVYHRSNGLLAVCGKDLCVRVYDTVTARLVRQFRGHRDRISDACFSGDGRWLLTAGMDRSVRTWDLMSGRQLDCMVADVAVTGLSLSPGMDMLATTHVNKNGIYLWANRMMYSDTDDVALFGSGQSERSVALPAVNQHVAGETGPESTPTSDGDSAVRGEQGDSEQAEAGVPAAVPQVVPEMVSLAMLPRSQWQTLIHLDIIKERNKPIEPPKTPEQAPFFLPTLPNLAGQTVFDLSAASASEKEASGISRVRRRALSVSHRSNFVALLYSGRENSDYSELLELLKGMSASAMDLELRSLEIVDSLEEVEEERIEDVACLLDFLVTETESKRCFELIQALLNRTLTIHGEVISKHAGLQGKARSLLELQKQTWSRLDSLFQSVRCMAGYLTSGL